MIQRRAQARHDTHGRLEIDPANRRSRQQRASLKPAGTPVATSKQRISPPLAMAHVRVRVRLHGIGAARSGHPRRQPPGSPPLASRATTRARAEQNHACSLQSEEHHVTGAVQGSPCDGDGHPRSLESSTTPVGWWWRWMLQPLDEEHLRAAVELRFVHRLASRSQGRRADGVSSSSRHHDQDVNHPVALARAQHRLDCLDGVITEQTAPAGTAQRSGWSGEVDRRAACWDCEPAGGEGHRASRFLSATTRVGDG